MPGTFRRKPRAFGNCGGNGLRRGKAARHWTGLSQSGHHEQYLLHRPGGELPDRRRTRFDQTEDLITRLVPVEEVPGLVASGKIRHCLVIAALFHFELWRKANMG